VPNMVLFAPRCEESMKNVMEFAYSYKGVSAFRYPRGAFILRDEFEAQPLEFGKGVILADANSDIAFLGYGNGVGKANLVRNLLAGKLDVILVDLVFAKPLDSELLLGLTKRTKKWYIFSDSAKKGGIGEIVSAFLQENKISNISVISFEYEDKFIPHGSTAEVEKHLGISAEQITKNLLENN
jgi:1-deoxy-D-xylulose-5-phosphate synthase